MSDSQPVLPKTLNLPKNWDSIYAATGDYFFGTEPSQIAQTAFRFFEAFGGDPKIARALDLGSGEGRDTAFLARAGMHVTARDVSEVGLEKTRTLLARRGVSPERVDLTIADIGAFEYPAAVYDIALAANVYQFLSPADVPGHLEKLKESVKPGGICAVGVFSPAMAGWGIELENYWTATADELLLFFSEDAGWLLLDRTEYWTYQVRGQTRMSFSYVVARKQEPLK
jgi:SAM-dependent methyltransferase